MSRAERAKELFLQGYACSQAVALVFADIANVDEATLSKMALPFGGGLGRLRLTCGAVSGMFFVLSYLYGYDTAGDDVSKKRLYTDVQALAGQFRERCGSIVCREILKNPPTDPTPSPRTAEYYQTRPCARMVLVAGQLMDEFIAEHPLEA